MKISLLLGSFNPIHMARWLETHIKGKMNIMPQEVWEIIKKQQTIS